jgi:glycosyltransferase involved in cell wall biosynthesis
MTHIQDATDAWHPQVNGEVRTLTAIAEAARGFGVEVSFLTPQSFRTCAMRRYPVLRLALPYPAKIAKLIEAAKPDSIHIATEGPIGLLVRRPCRMRGFRNVVMWSRGVDTSLFHPRRADLCLPTPVFLCVGRVAVEKNLEAFLDLDLPGTKLVVGDGPALTALQQKYPDAVFLGARHGEELAEIYAASDIFVFPSKTDTFGLVLLEALASGLPVAAFPVTGPRDVIGAALVGVLDEDLRVACLEALQVSREDCVEFAATHTWQASARVFVEHALNVRSEPSEGEVAEFGAEDPHFAA